jgi:hypothetical protein
MSGTTMLLGTGELILWLAAVILLGEALEWLYKRVRS